MMMRSYAGPLVLSLAIVLFILVLQFLARYVDDIFGKGVGGMMILKVFMYASATLLTMALPLSILMASLMAVGNMGERYELAAIKSAGISLVRLVKPMTLMTVLITLFSMYFSFYMVPKSNLKLFSLIYDLSKVKPSFALSAGHFYGGLDGYVIYIADKNSETDMLYKIKIYDHSEDTRRGNFKVLVADSARMAKEESGRFMTMRLFSGVNHQEYAKKQGEPNKMSYSRSYFDTLEYHFPLTGFDLDHSTKIQLSPHRYMKDIVQLYLAIDSMKVRGENHLSKLGDYMAPILMVDSFTVLGIRPVRRADTLRLLPTEKTNQPIRPKIQQFAGEKIPDPPVPENKAVRRDTTPAFYKIPVIAFTTDSTKVKHMWEYFPYVKQADILAKALNDARTLKNYTKFTWEKVEDEKDKERRYATEFYTRLLLPIACLVFLLIGAPLGAIIRKGGLGVPAIVSILFFILFYVLMIQGKKLAHDGIWPEWVGVFLPLWVIFPMGIILTWMAATDSNILDINQWKIFFGRISGIFGKS